MEFAESLDDHAFALRNNVEDGVGLADGPLGHFEILPVRRGVGGGG